MINPVPRRRSQNAQFVWETKQAPFPSFAHPPSVSDPPPSQRGDCLNLIFHIAIFTPPAFISLPLIHPILTRGGTAPCCYPPFFVHRQAHAEEMSPGQASKSLIFLDRWVRHKCSLNPQPSTQIRPEYIGGRLLFTVAPPLPGGGVPPGHFGSCRRLEK